MSNTFFDTSKQISSDFLQNVVFIDDKAFDISKEKGKHDFDPYLVTTAFASHKKICAVYNPKTLDDIDYLIGIAKKADVTVLDWQIDIKKEMPAVEVEEEDDENEDPRGTHTIKIIREILHDPVILKGSLKFFLIYTGESNLDGIAEAIHKDLSAAGIDTKKGYCEVCTDNIKIVVIAKADQSLVAEGRQHEQFQQNADLKARIVSYEQLPNFIIERFTKITTGLLPNFALKALTVIRENTFTLVSRYNKDLDVAFLADRLLRPDQDDSKELVVELFSHSIHSLLTYNLVGETVNTNEVIKWVDTMNFSTPITISKKSTVLDNNFIKLWSEFGFIKSCTIFWETNNFGRVDEKQKEAFNKTLRNFKGYFLSGDKNNKDDRQFSILTHHKSIFKPYPTAPRLTLGTVIKGTNSSTYWVCIQQRCDSVRINGQRRFLFLPLEELPANSEADYHFVTEHGIRLKLKNKSYELRTIKFLGNKTDEVVKAKKEKGKFLFEPYHYATNRRSKRLNGDELFEWIFDLKDLHAQRIATEFANELSRVGLDEAEWLRRGYTK